MTTDRLLTPGPTPLPPQVRQSLGQPIIHHRTAQYRELFKQVLQGMQGVMQTKNTVLCLTSSGTGAMEAAVCNLLAPGDEAIVVLGGKFAERWQKLCQAFGAKPITIPVAYGDPVDPAQVEQALRQHPNAKAVFTTLCETSTGVHNDIEAIAAITRKSPAVLVVDAISGLMADPCRTDAWGVDIVVTGSQKALMLPPGLAFMSVSEKAWARIDACPTPRYYYDLRAYRKGLANDDTPFTPAVSLVLALQESIKLIEQTGAEETVERCAVLAKATRAGMQALGLKIFSKRPSNGVTAVIVPEGVDGKKLTKAMYERSRVMVAGGQGEMEGKIFRFAHMGAIGPEDILAGLTALEDALGSLGYKVAAGASTKAAQAVLEQSSLVAAK